MSVRTLVKSIQDIMRKDSGVDGDAQRISQLCWLFFMKIIDDQDQELELMRDGYQSPVPAQFQWRNWAADPEGLTGEALLAFVNEELFPAMKGLKPTGQPGDRRRVVRDVFEDAYNYMKSGQLLRQVVNKINGIDFNNLSERQHFGDVYEQLLNDLQSAGNAGEYYTPRAVTAFMVDRIDPKPGEIIFDPSCGTGGFLTCAMKHMRDRYVKRPEDEALMQQSLRAVEKKPLPHMLCVTNMLLHGVEDPSFVRHDNTLARPYISWEQKDRVDVILTNPPFGGKEEDGIESNFPQHFRTRETADLFLDPAEGGAARRVQPAHHRSPAQFRVQALRLHRHQPAVLRKGRADQGHLVLRTSGASGAESLFDDEANPRRAFRLLRGMVGRCGTQGPRGRPAGVEGQRRRGEGTRLQPRLQEPA
jgi:type I restriction enzyme M protein